MPPILELPRIRARLPADAGAPARARATLAVLRGAVGEQRLRRLELIVSELVTNAVLHSGAATVGLEVRCEEHRVTLSVEDTGPGFLVEHTRASPSGRRNRRPPGDDTPGGWGLLLVAELADAWRVEPGAPTRVVAELSR